MLVAAADHEVVRLDLLPAGARQLGLKPAWREVREVALVEEAGRGDVPTPGKQLGGQIEVRDIGGADDQRRARVPVCQVGQDGEQLSRASQTLDHLECCDGRKLAAGEDLLEALDEPSALAEIHECGGESLLGKIFQAVRFGADPEIVEADLRARCGDGAKAAPEVEEHSFVQSVSGEEPDNVVVHGPLSVAAFAELAHGPTGSRETVDCVRTIEKECHPLRAGNRRRQAALRPAFPEGLGSLTLRLTSVLAVPGEPVVEPTRAPVLLAEQQVRLRGVTLLLRRDEQPTRAVDTLVKDYPGRGPVGALVAGQP